jgi:hypothetical protein
MEVYCCPIEFEITPLSKKTLSLCEDACNGIGDNIFCCCWICTPVTFIIDIITCCPRCVCYKCKEYKKDKTKPVIMNQPL